MPLHPLETTLQQLADPLVAENSKRFYKSDEPPNQHLGIRMPTLRELAKKNHRFPLEQIPDLLSSKFHESRLLALLILVQKFKSADDAERSQIYSMYLDHTAFLNSWDLIDCSVYFIVGPYLEKRDRTPLYRLAKSPSLWERRIAVVATLHFIRKGDFDDTLRLAEILLQDGEDLIHKAVGWMLKETGKRDRKREDTFLRNHYSLMPRTMLRVALEKHPQKERQACLKGEF